MDCRRLLKSESRARQNVVDCWRIGFSTASRTQFDDVLVRMLIDPLKDIRQVDVGVDTLRSRRPGGRGMSRQGPSCYEAGSNDEITLANPLEEGPGQRN